MKVQLRFLSGARTGQVEVFGKAYIGLGRHPLSDGRFDAERDLDVSSRHAAIIRHDAQFIVRDLGSKNGTRVNGRIVTGDVSLADGDILSFGPQGPSLEFRILEADAADEVPAAARASADRISSPREQYPAVPAPPPGSPARASTAARIAAEVNRRTRKLHRTTKVLLALLLVSAVGLAWVQWTSARNAREIDELRARADSLNRTAQQLLSQVQVELQTVRDALRQSEAEAARMRNELDAAASSGDASAVARLRGRLDSAETRQRGLADAAAVDYRGIARRNTDAVALVLVKFSDAEVFSGTAFAVDSQGTLVTNKHLLTDEEGRRQPLGIAVKFSGSEQWFKGRVLGVSDSADLGVLRVDIRGGTPRVLGITGGASGANGLQRGDPVAIIGYPLGEDLPMERQGESAIADPTLTVGTVSKVLPNLVQVDGYGAPGSSGSPIFARDGRVVAVLYGGERESQGKIIYAVPGALVAQYLSHLGIRH